MLKVPPKRIPNASKHSGHLPLLTESRREKEADLTESIHNLLEMCVKMTFTLRMPRKKMILKTG